MTGILQKRYVNPYYYWADEFTPYQNHVKSVQSSDGLKSFDQSERWVILEDRKQSDWSS